MAASLSRSRRGDSLESARPSQSAAVRHSATFYRSGIKRVILEAVIHSRGITSNLIARLGTFEPVRFGVSLSLKLPFEWR